MQLRTLLLREIAMVAYQHLCVEHGTLPCAGEHFGVYHGAVKA